MKKERLKLVIIFGVIIIVIASISCFVVSNLNSPNKVVKKYCDILVKGSYGDIIDIAYLPNSELVTKEKIEELKTEYFNEMKKDNNEITSCTFTKANETDDILTYKLTMETTSGIDTIDIEVRKADNKIIIEGLYKKISLVVYKGSTVYVDNKKVSIKPDSQKDDEGNQEEVYKLTILDNINYDLKITHPIFKDVVSTLNNDMDYASTLKTDFKDDYSKKLETDVNTICNKIITIVFEKGDIESLNEYFLNNDAGKFIANNHNLNGTEEVPFSDEYNVKFEKVLDTLIENVDYINDNELLLKTRTSYQQTLSAKSSNQIIFDEGKIVDSFVKGFDEEFVLHWVKTDSGWKISSWN